MIEDKAQAEAIAAWKAAHPAEISERERRAAWTKAKQARRAERESAWGEQVAYTNRFRFSPLFGVILTDDLSLPSLPAAKNCAVFLWVSPEQLLLGCDRSIAGAVCWACPAAWG